MLGSSGLLLVWLNLLSAASALYFSQPSSTSAPYVHQHDSAPTLVYKMGGSVEQSDQNLFGRQQTFTSATCGYYSGLAASPITCNAGSECGFFPAPTTAPNFGCCSGTTGQVGCGYVSTCVEYTAGVNSEIGGGVGVFSSSFFCGSNSPYCKTVKLLGSNGTSYLSYACQTNGGTTVTAYVSTTDPTTSTPSSSTSASTSRISSSVVGSTSSGDRGQGPPTAASSATHPGLTGDAKIGVGVGVGVGVGCILIALGLFFGLKRRDARKSRDLNGAQTYQPNQQSPAQSNMQQYARQSDGMNGIRYSPLQPDHESFETFGRSPGLRSDISSHRELLAHERAELPPGRLPG